MNLVLVGFMASGKTAIGRRLAQRLGYRFVDTDQVIEKETGRTIADIFEREGEGYFRAIETTIAQALSHMENTIISTGGGIVTVPGNMEKLKKAGLVVFLNARREDILDRLARDTRRPLVQGENLEEKVDRLMAQRMELYLQADLVMDTGGKSPQQVASEIIRQALAHKPAPPESAPEDQVQEDQVQEDQAPEIQAQAEG